MIRKGLLVNEQNKLLSYFLRLVQCLQYADTKGQELIKQELKRVKEEYKQSEKEEW